MTDARSMLQAMARPATLWAAWARVAAGSGMAGADGVTVAEFAQRLGPRLELLSGLLLSGGYWPQPLRLVLASRAGKVRHRGVPTVADRVAQRAFLQVCSPRLEAARAEVSFAYRRGRSWVDALARAGRCRTQGLCWVFRTDIADFFESVDHGLLRTVVAAHVADPAVVDLVDAWVRAPALTQNGVRARSRGWPEGAPLSPTLANLYLRRFAGSLATHPPAALPAPGAGLGSVVLDPENAQRRDRDPAGQPARPGCAADPQGTPWSGPSPSGE